ncbi:MAG: hypothetical protein WD037_04690 [Balneolales bacterium]
MIEQLSRKGRGPGEYQMPLFITQIEGDKIAFSEPSSMDITVLDADGKHVRTIYHEYGGGAKFIYSDEKIYVQGKNNGYQVHILDEEGNHIRDMIPFKEGYEERAKSFNGGGIVNISNTYYAMNSLEPVIYTFKDGEETANEITPPEWEKFTYNFDLEYLNNNSPRELGDENNLIIFTNLHKMQIGNEPYLAVSGNSTERILYLFTQDLDLKYIYKPEMSIIGIHNNQIFEMDRDAIEAAVYIVSF